MTRLATAAMLTAIALSLTACGGSDAHDASPPPSAGSESSSSPGQATEEPAQPTEPPLPEYKMLSKARLQRTLLSIREVPAGYALEPPEDDGDSDSYCGYEPPSQPTVKVRSDYVKGGGFSSQLLSLSIGQYKSQDGPKGYLRDFAKQLRKCPSENLDGEFVEYAEMSAPQVGDESLGVRIEAESYTVVANLARVGPVLILVGGGGVTNADADEIGRLFEEQVNKYLQAAKS